MDTGRTGSPHTSGVSVSLTVAPMPWMANAVARCSGKRLDSDAMAVGCQSAMPTPTSPAAASAYR